MCLILLISWFIRNSHDFDPNCSINSYSNHQFIKNTKKTFPKSKRNRYNYYIFYNNNHNKFESCSQKLIIHRTVLFKLLFNDFCYYFATYILITSFNSINIVIYFCDFNKNYFTCSFIIINNKFNRILFD